MRYNEFERGGKSEEKNNSFTTLLVIGGSAGIYTAFAAESEQAKQKANTAVRSEESERS